LPVCEEGQKGDELRRAVCGSEDVVVDDSQKLEGTGDAKQRPLELTVCDVSDEQNATHF